MRKFEVGQTVYICKKHNKQLGRTLEKGIIIDTNKRLLVSINGVIIEFLTFPVPNCPIQFHQSYHCRKVDLFLSKKDHLAAVKHYLTYRFYDGRLKSLTIKQLDAIQKWIDAAANKKNQ